MNFIALFCHRFVIYGSRFRAGKPGQANLKERARAKNALYADLAAVSLDNPLDNRQPQTGAACLRVS